MGTQPAPKTPDGCCHWQKGKHKALNPLLITRLWVPALFHSSRPIDHGGMDAFVEVRDGAFAEDRVQ